MLKTLKTKHNPGADPREHMPLSPFWKGKGVWVGGGGVLSSTQHFAYAIKDQNTLIEQSLQFRVSNVKMQSQHFLVMIMYTCWYTKDKD